MSTRRGNVGLGMIAFGATLAWWGVGGPFIGHDARAQQVRDKAAPQAEKADKEKVDVAVQRTRKQVLMLDDLYKTAVVLITDKYVQKETDLAAATAAQALFDVMRKKGHHDVRLLDATGTPYDDDNVARDDFEKEAIRQLKAGQATYERVEQRDGGRVLRMATPIPVVMDKCVMCHEVYKSAKKGEAIGALSYTVRVE